MSATSPSAPRRRPNFRLIEDERKQHAEEMIALLAEREKLMDRLARAWKWQAAIALVGGVLGGLLGHAL